MGEPGRRMNKLSGGEASRGGLASGENPRQKKLQHFASAEALVASRPTLMVRLRLEIIVESKDKKSRGKIFIRSGYRMRMVGAAGRRTQQYLIV